MNGIAQDLLHLLNVWTEWESMGGLLLIFEVGVTHYISVGNLRKEALWRGCYSLGTIRWSWVVFVFQSKSVTCWKRWDRAVFTGNLDEDSPGTRNCGDVRFCFSMTLGIGSEPEATSKIIVVAQQIIWVFVWVLQSSWFMNLRCNVGSCHSGLRN